MALKNAVLAACVSLVLVAGGPPVVGAITRAEKQHYKNKVVEMFFHAYNSYMNFAYPADELMPLSCKGRVRGVDRSRGSVDEALGSFSLTLIDSLDTLAVLGALDEFSEAIQLVLRDVRYDSDLVVSVFETNIRVLGGLLGAHFAAVALKEKGHHQLSWYSDQLLEKAEEVGQRLLPAFNTTTGLPYPKINLLRGMAYGDVDKTTCTACAGTNILEFAALSRLTGNAAYETKARRSMEAIWMARHRGHDLVGTTIDINNGQWTRKDSGVGAGIDSYYEYCLKYYILLGDTEYLHRFSKHYAAIKKYISNGPLLVDVNMASPNKMARSFMDSLLAFWPGLQVLWGDIGAAIHTHDMLYHVTQRHNFLPEAFTLDFKVHWGQHPLRPEFIESTYFLYMATGDPYYLDVGKTVIDNLNEHARVNCGFAGIKDVKLNTHEDRMDSFVLAETFKYLYLLFSEEEDLLLDMNDFVFNTEAHLFPLSLANSPSPPPPSPSSTTSPSSSVYLKATESTDQSGGSDTATPTDVGGNESVVMTQPLVCRKDSFAAPYIQADRYRRMMLQQCTVSRFGIRPPPQRKRNDGSVYQSRLSVSSLDFADQEQLSILKDMGIVVQAMSGGRVQISHTMQLARNQEDAEEGWYLMQEIIKAMDAQRAMGGGGGGGGGGTREAKQVWILSPDVEDDKIVVGPALFGPDLGGDKDFQVAAGLVILEESSKACSPLPGHLGLSGKIVLIHRGGCLFVQKVREAQKVGAVGVIIEDNVPTDQNADSVPQTFSMSGDATSGDIQIPSVFMLAEDGARLRDVAASSNGEEVFVLLTWMRKKGEEGGGEVEGEEGEVEEGQGEGSDSWKRTAAGDSNRQSSPSHSSYDENSNH